MPNAHGEQADQKLERHLGCEAARADDATRPCHERGAAYTERKRHLLAELDEIESTLVGRKPGPGRLRVDTGAPLQAISDPAFGVRGGSENQPNSASRIGRSFDRRKIDCAIRSTAQDPA